MADTAQILPTQYPSSKGLMTIADMAYPHITNAIGKMERDGRSDEPVYAALVQRRNVLDAEREEAGTVDGDQNDRAVIGGNNPPPATTYEAIKAELEDLRTEAGAWLDGAKITSQAEADKIGTLRAMIDAAMAKAEKARVAEKEPFDRGAKEVQDRYNILIGETKAVTGTAVIMRRTINSALTAWLNKVAADQEAARLEALRIAREADEKAREHISHTHDTTDIDDREAALAEVDVARQAAIDLAAVNRQKAQVQTGGRAIGLVSTFRPEITDRQEALRHYREDRLAEYVTELEAIVIKFATADIRAGKRSGIPGVNIVEERNAR